MRASAAIPLRGSAEAPLGPLQTAKMGHIYSTIAVIRDLVAQGAHLGHQPPASVSVAAPHRRRTGGSSAPSHGEG